MTTMTTAEIQTQIDDVRDKVRILTDRQGTCAARLSEGKRRMADVTAGKVTLDVAETAELRAQNRDAAEELDEISLGLETLNRERVALEGQHRKAETREAGEEADRLVEEAEAAANGVADLLNGFLVELGEAVAEATQKINSATYADSHAANLRGESPRFGPQVYRAGFSRSTTKFIEAIGEVQRELGNEERMSSALQGVR
jgi:hypothetical protein